MGYGTDGLTFNTLRNANVRRLPLSRNRKGELSHEQENDPGSNWSVSEWLEAVIGELGEFANLHKKVRRGDFSLVEAQPELAKELADIIIYLDILAYRLHIDLGQAVMSKWNETSEKIGAPIRIDPDDWHYCPAWDRYGILLESKK